MIKQRFSENRAAVFESAAEMEKWGYDWNAAGALPLRADALKSVREMYLFRFTNPLPSPVVIANADGTLDIEYDGKDGRKLFLTFKCDRIISYIKIYPDDQTTIEGLVRVGEWTDGDEGLEELRSLCSWLRLGAAEED